MSVPDYQATAISALGLIGSNGSNGGNGSSMGSSGRQEIGNVTDRRSCRRTPDRQLWSCTRYSLHEEARDIKASQGLSSPFMRPGVQSYRMYPNTDTEFHIFRIDVKEIRL